MKMYLMWPVRQADALAGGSDVPLVIGAVARWRVYIVLVDVAELLVHGIRVEGLALIGLLLPPEIARIYQLPVCLIRYHGMAPPVRHRPEVVVVVVCHSVPDLHLFQCHCQKDLIETVQVTSDLKNQKDES